MPAPDRVRPASSADPDELRRFAALAGHWWDETGPLAPLHRLNPTRLAYLRDRICARFERDPLADRPLAGLDVLDVGCGGGLLCEPLARLGAAVTGIDLEPANLAVAAGTPRRALGSRSTTARPRPSSWRPRVPTSIWCASWRWSSTSPIRPASSPPAADWSHLGGGLVLATLNRTLGRSRSASLQRNTCSAGCLAARIAGRASCARRRPPARSAGAA